MKTHRITFRAVDHDKFAEIQQGTKTIETRAATPKYQAIRPGDSLEFVCANESCTKQVEAIELYDSLDHMFDELPLSKILPSAATRGEAGVIYASFPGYTDKLNEYGVLAFLLK